MEAQLYPDGVPQPGLVPPSEALPALKLRETSCYSGTYGLYVEGGPGCDPGTYTGHTQQAYTLNTGVMAVGLTALATHHPFAAAGAVSVRLGADGLFTTAPGSGKNPARYWNARYQFDGAR